jgi:type II secretory pathway component PulK
MKNGFALITILAVVIMIALGAAALLQSVGSHIGMKSNNLQEVKAQYLAEAGMQYAMWKCRS